MVQIDNVTLGGKKKVTVTSVTLVNNTALTLDVTVPSSRRWMILNIKVTNMDNVTRTVTVNHYLESAKTNLVKILNTYAMATLTTLNTPNGLVDSAMRVCANLSPFHILNAGETISVTWSAGGASAGATDADGFVIEALEMIY